MFSCVTDIVRLHKYVSALFTTTAQVMPEHFNSTECIFSTHMGSYCTIQKVPASLFQNSIELS